MKRVGLDEKIRTSPNCSLHRIPSFLNGAYFFETRFDKEEKGTLSVKVKGQTVIYLMMKNKENISPKSTMSDKENNRPERSTEGEEADRLDPSQRQEENNQTSSPTDQEKSNRPEPTTNEEGNDENIPSSGERKNNSTSSPKENSCKGRKDKCGDDKDKDGEENANGKKSIETLLTDGKWVKHKHGLVTSCSDSYNIWEKRIIEADDDNTIVLPEMHYSKISIFVTGKDV